MAGRKLKSNPFGDDSGGGDNDITSAFQRPKKNNATTTSVAFPSHVLGDSVNPFDDSIPTVAARRVQSTNPFSDHYSPPTSPPSSRDPTPRKLRGNPFSDSPPDSPSMNRNPISNKNKTPGKTGSEAPTPAKMRVGSERKQNQNPFGDSPVSSPMSSRNPTPMKMRIGTSGINQNPFDDIPATSPSTSRNATPAKLRGKPQQQNPFDDSPTSSPDRVSRDTKGNILQTSAKPPIKGKAETKVIERAASTSKPKPAVVPGSARIKTPAPSKSVGKSESLATFEKSGAAVNSRMARSSSTGSTGKSNDTVPLIPAMDTDDSSTMKTNTSKPIVAPKRVESKFVETKSTSVIQSSGGSSTGPSAPSKNNELSAVPSTTIESNANNSKTKKKKQAAVTVPKRNKKKERLERLKNLAVLKSKITRWPYDDYHKEQERYYELLQETSEGTVVDGSNLASSINSKGSGYDYVVSDDEESGGMNRQKKLSVDDRSGDKLLERPEPLPSIKEVVHDLPLLRFEDEATERAIDLVNIWLFDSGLIDELLAHGGISYSTASISDSSNMMGSSLSSIVSTSNRSVFTSQGVEIGMHGFPISGNANEGGLRVDKELERFRVSVERELNAVNSKLNDGISASRAEVEDLVKAVAATKSDLGRLRELTTYVSNSGNDMITAGSYKGNTIVGTEMNFFLSKYPRLKRVINARRNLFRCFRDLEFFSQIPSTCDRLREELHHGEWTVQEWNTIRNVCMEHVELEILLVEAEAGMKERIDEEDGSRDESASRTSRRYRSSGDSESYDMVDTFLSPFVKNVWELGDEIRMRIISGVGTAFDLATENPAGMVALVEAVEVYERASEQYKLDHGAKASRRNKLHFTDMRAAALAQLYQDFELRGLEVFRAIHMQAADMADEEDALNSQFTAVLRAATELVTEIDVVKNQMSPCFAPHWHVEMLWSSCVAHVCSNQIIQQIGGPDGHNLPDLTVNQLLDLVAWVEFFRETIEDTFPTIATMRSKKTYFDSRPDLFAGDNRMINMENATDSLAWVNNMLWEVHRLAQDEFLLRTRAQTEKWLENVYCANHEKHQTYGGRLTTSICEDIFSLASVQVGTIRERLSRKSDALVMAICVIFSHLRSCQIKYRDRFLVDLESCCAAANDFQRMSEKCEDLLQEVIDDCDFPEESLRVLQESTNEVLNLYSADAVFAAQSAHLFIFEPIGATIAESLFASEWENNLTHNELALTLVKTLEDFMGDLEQYLDEFMLKKTVDALVTSSVFFYVKCLLLKAESHSSNRNPYFADIRTALNRMDGDVRIIVGYFDDLADGMPALSKVIEKEFELITTIQELMRIAADLSESDAADFIIVLHKKLQDIDITKHVIGDLWHLVQPPKERTAWELVESMETTLHTLVPPDEKRLVYDRMDVPGLRLNETMAKIYIASKRKRPVKPGALEKIILNWTRNNRTNEEPVIIN